ncbi:MAG TPA: hypothetical protein VIB62_08675 [Actinomycetota bacterium]|jgi:hypothetical protein
MKKRFAILVGGALAAVLLAGSAALSFGVLGTQPATAGSDSSVPKVRTIERTVTIHEQRKPQRGTVVELASSTVSSTVAGEGHEDEGDEHEDEGDEHEDEGSWASDGSHSLGDEDD